MKPYFISIKAANTTYSYGRYFTEAERAAVADTLGALFHLKLIDAFNIKEAKTYGVTIGEAADVH